MRKTIIPEYIPKEIREFIVPFHKPFLVYKCIECEQEYDILQFLYTCPRCGGLLKIVDKHILRLKRGKEFWKKVFDFRKISRISALRGVFLYHEFLLPIVPLDDIIYLGEGHTPVIRCNDDLASELGFYFYVKNDGQNPSASFKDRGMACAISFVNYLIKEKNLKSVLGICASTGDTSASAALYLSYLPKDIVKSVVILPKGKVTPTQLSQPLASGAKVIEIDGVFDDCMKIVESIAKDYDVCLLNSKNPIRIQGQKSYAFEIAHHFDFSVGKIVVVVPIGNAGNVTAIMEGFYDLKVASVIDDLPIILGVQSYHANPVANWFRTSRYAPVKVKPSVAQAAMIGDPVSFPKVKRLKEEIFKDRFLVVDVSEQSIMDTMIFANRFGHILCTQGAEALAGLKKAKELGMLPSDYEYVVDSTSSQLKFSGFQMAYLEKRLHKDYEITPKDEYIDLPTELPKDPTYIANYLGLKKK